MNTNLHNHFNPMINQLLDDLHRLIGPVYLVGGGLRESLLDQPLSSELDLLVLLPLEICRHRLMAAGFQNLTPGNKYNSLLLHLNREEEPREISITTCRHRPSQRPTVKEDLLHRDITVNAMAYQWPDGPLTDPFHGLEDLAHRRIRLVNGATTLQNDPLRAVRFYRFLLQLQGEPDMDDLALVERYSLEWVTEERLRNELDKIFSLPLESEQSRKWFLRLFNSPLAYEIVPALQGLKSIFPDPNHQESLWDLSINMMLHIPPPEEGEDMPLADLRWCALLHEIGRVKGQEEGNRLHGQGHYFDETIRLLELFMTSHGFSKRRIRRILNIIPHLDFDLFATDRALRRLIQNHVPLEGLFRLLKAKRDASVHLEEDERLKLAEKYRRAMRRCQILRQALSRFSVQDLAISGGDIMELIRLRPGPWVGKLQEHLISWVTEDPSRNRRPELEKRCWEWVAENDMFSFEGEV
ncbi:MAG: CCA tRNA nucleotidyltransferase [Magnetococcales bacterium]|nr:CCA tRNA nucleotidyltransferase [Magnetococcales bacterium]NGZ26152.1 CCA tRNA nucleotidyltransferase [Magnetococcales bacterium]